MTKPQALQVLEEIKTVCRKHGLWFQVELHKKPDLRMVLIKEIAIKVTEGEK